MVEVVNATDEIVGLWIELAAARAEQKTVLGEPTRPIREQSESGRVGGWRLYANSGPGATWWGSRAKRLPIREELATSWAAVGVGAKPGATTHVGNLVSMSRRASRKRVAHAQRGPREGRQGGRSPTQSRCRIEEPKGLARQGVRRTTQRKGSR